LRDYSRAIKVVQEAMSHLEQQNIDPEDKDKWLKALSYRLERIKRKKAMFKF